MKTVYKARYRNMISVLADVRKAAQLTQQQLAEKLHKPQSYIAKIEGFERKLDLLEFIEMCEALKVSPSALIQKIEHVEDGLKE